MDPGQDDHLAWRTCSADDLPFHYALADAFTVCDAYHCSMLGPTDPNRYYMWTGWDGNDGKGGGPVIANDEIGYSWQTYPERLQAAGISWKIYQDKGPASTPPASGAGGSDAYIGNYGDNSLLYFTQYQNAPPGSPLATRARAPGPTSASGGGFFDILTADVKTGQAAERLLDRRSRGVHRASGLAGRLGAPGTPPAC